MSIPSCDRRLGGVAAFLPYEDLENFNVALMQPVVSAKAYLFASLPPHVHGVASLPFNIELEMGLLTAFPRHPIVGASAVAKQLRWRLTSTPEDRRRHLEEVHRPHRDVCDLYAGIMRNYVENKTSTSADKVSRGACVVCAALVSHTTHRLRCCRCSARSSSMPR